MTRRCRPLALLLAAALAAAGCAVGPNYARPTALTPPAYKELQGWKVAAPADDTVRGAWWRTFGDSQLNALAEQVSISNQNLAAAEAQFRQARVLVLVARSQYFPTATVGVGYSRARQSETFTDTSGRTVGSTAPRSDLILPIDISWEPDLWGRVRRSVESNRANAQASAADVETSRLLFQAEVAQDYFQLRTLDGQRQLLEAAVAAFQISLRLTQNRYAAGVASGADVAQAETQLKTTQAQAIDVGVQRAQLEHAIAVLIGQPPAMFSLPVLPLTTTAPPIPIGVPSELLERRPDIAATERRVAAANAQIGVAMAAFFPTVTLSISAGFESGGLAKWLTWPSRFWSVGPSISQTVFDGGLRRAQSAQARAAWEGSIATYRQTVFGAFQEVEDNLAALRILEEEARVQDDAVKAAQRSLALTTNQYRAGTVSYLNVVVAQTAALTNEQTAVTIAGRRLNAAVLLVKALGGGWSAAQLPSDRDVTRLGAPR